MVGPSRNSFVTFFHGAWLALGVSIGAGIMFVVWFKTNAPLALGLGATVYVGAMLWFGIALLRSNLKGSQRLEVSPTEVLRTWTFQFHGNGEQKLRNTGTFAIGYPISVARTQLDYGFWGEGFLFVAHVDGSRKTILLNGLRKQQARRVGEALRSAGYTVSNFELVA